MTTDYYFAGLHFVPLSSAGPKFFGLAEYISGLALMVLAWTIADSKYRFRIEVAPFNARKITYAVVVLIGFATLFTDIWRAAQWHVIEIAGSPLTPVVWQGILALVFLGAFCGWAALAFFISARFHRGNAVRYFKAMKRATLQGSGLELSVIAEELAAGIPGVVKHATNRDFRAHPQDEVHPYRPSATEQCANSILGMLGDRRFSAAIADKSPGTALILFEEVQKQERFDIDVGTFARNLVAAAIANKDSFIYHETLPAYLSGFLGWSQPLTSAMFGDYTLVSGIDTLFDVYYEDKRLWDTRQWAVYSKVMGITLGNFIAAGGGRDRTTMNRAIGNLREVTSPARWFKGTNTQAELSDIAARFDIVAKFVHRALVCLNRRTTLMDQRLRRRQLGHAMPSIYELLATLIFETFQDAANIRSPVDSASWIQLNVVWLGMFDPEKFETKAGRIIRLNVFKKILGELHRMETFPNFAGAHLLGFCLNVLGLRLWHRRRDRLEVRVHKIILEWTKSNYGRFLASHPIVAAACFVDGFTYDVERRLIVRTFTGVLGRKPRVSYLPIYEAWVPA